MPYEEALLRAQLNAKPITDELKEQVFSRIVKPKFIKYLAKEYEDKKQTLFQNLKIMELF